jgi:hypothetical protein
MSARSWRRSGVDVMLCRLRVSEADASWSRERTDAEDFFARQPGLKDVHLERAVRRIKESLGREVFAVVLSALAITSNRNTRNESRRRIRLRVEHDRQLKIIEVVSHGEERSKGGRERCSITVDPSPATAIVEEDLPQTKILSGRAHQCEKRGRR